MVYGDWSKEKITRHSLSANISASVMDKMQSITLSADLPPRDSSASMSAAMRMWISETTGSMKIQFWDDTEKRVFDPLTVNQTFRFGSFGSLTGYIVYDWGDEKLNREKGFTTITSTLSLPKWWLNASYSATRSAGYELDPARGWVLSTGEQSLKHKDLNISFNPKQLTGKLWDNRLNYAVSFTSRLYFDLQRYTGSNFNMTLGFTLGITNFLDFSINFNSTNSVIYRYYRALIPNLDPRIANATGDQYNIFLDLLNSFRFDDENRRRSSGFKMNTFSLRADHKLGDWNAALTVTMNPYLPTGERQYKLNSEISFSVHWIPVGEIKTDMTYSKRDDKWTVK
jgi:hypothetical protein